MMSIQLVIFDMAGTTVEDNNYVGMHIEKALNQHGYEATQDDIRAVMGIEKPVAIRMLLTRSLKRDDVSDDLVMGIHQTYLQQMLSFYREDPRVSEIEGTTSVFQKLTEAGLRIGLDTGFDRKTADIIIDRLGWRDVIDASVTSDEVENGRPAPDMGLKLMEILGINSPESVAKVGDTISDLGEGSALGCKFNIGVTSGAYTRDQLKTFPHTHIIESIRDLPPIVLEEA